MSPSKLSETDSDGTNELHRDLIDNLVVTRYEELSNALLGQTDSIIEPRFLNQLSEVLMASDFVFEQLLRLTSQPLPIEFTCFQQSLWQPYQQGEHIEQLSALTVGCQTEEPLMSLLRRYRNLAMVRIIWREATGAANLWESTASLSELASASLEIAINFSMAELKPLIGAPFSDLGEQQYLGILGLGKLGAKELNLSSDIDLMFVYGDQGTTKGGGREVDNQKYFIKLGQKIIHLLQAVTEDGFVFRVDMRLRPFGSSGALSQSINAMIAYYQNQGREWERYALVKASHVAGDQTVCTQLLASLQPFVYRRYLDYSVFESLREMKALINREVSRTDAGENIKIGSGGIREIEFIVQTFQMIRGGKNSQLRDQQLEKVYWVLVSEGLMSFTTVKELVEAYLFLRSVEHRLQGLADLQTHDLPANKFDQLRLALSLGFNNWQDFKSTIDKHRRNVRLHFNQVIEEPGGEAEAPPAQFFLWWHDQLSVEQLEKLPGKNSESTLQLNEALSNFRNERKVVGLKSIARRRLDQLMPHLLQKVAGSQNLEVVLPRVLGVIGAIVRRSAYISLLNESPDALMLLIQLCDASAWIAEQLTLHPILLDELLNAEQLFKPPPKDELVEELNKQMACLPVSGLEEIMELLRHFKLAHELRVAVSETTGTMSTMKVSDYLTFLAEVILKAVLQHAWLSLVSKHGAPASLQGVIDELPFIIVAYGKLGGLELCYSSDLDLVFLLSELPQGMTSGERPIENTLFYTRLAQKIIHMLTTRTMSGALYEVDLRLRPSGGAGLMVSTLAGFEKYQLETAWTWEHQALVRARVVEGDAPGKQYFQSIRHRVLACERDPVKLQIEVAEMRTKMRNQLCISNEETFDLKQSKGGMVDIEFLVQYSVLRWAAEYPELTRYTDNVRILEQMASFNIITSSESKALTETYLYCRALSHQLALQKEKNIVSLHLIKSYLSIVESVSKKLLDI